MGCAQLEQLNRFIDNKRTLARLYESLFEQSPFQFVTEPPDCRSNYWLNAIICPDKKSRDELLEKTNQASIMTRPIWQTLHSLPMFNNYLKDGLSHTNWLAERIVNLPSSVYLGNKHA